MCLCLGWADLDLSASFWALVSVVGLFLVVAVCHWFNCPLGLGLFSVMEDAEGHGCLEFIKVNCL